MPNSPAAAASMIPLTSFFTVLSLALFFTSLQAQGATSSKEYQSLQAYLPVRSVVYRSVAALPSATVRTEAVGYQPFELCDDCKCCASSNSSNCVGARCCYAIDCNLPGKPFGTCAFIPQTCGCGDTNCTQPS